MLSTFPFDPCSREKILDYCGVPEFFGIYGLVLLTLSASSSSGRAASSSALRLSPPPHRRSGFPSASSCCISLPRVALYLFHLGFSFPLASSALATRTPSPCGRHRAAAVASSNPSASSYVCESISTTGISSTCSNRPFASSLPLAPGTPSPSPPERRRAQAHRRPASLQLLRLQSPHR
jgi:hypothetical protein